MEKEKKTSTEICKKQYYRIEFSLASALAVGSGQNVMTDKDIVKNSRGEPYIPGTALAGIYRTFFKNPEKYFGSLEKGSISRMITYDARILEADPENIKVSNRDCVGLDQYKTGIPGAKFDFEILEPGIRFVTYLEQNQYETENDSAADVIAQAWMEQRIVIGGKNTRGLGQVKDVQVLKKEFDFEKQSDISIWTDFDLYSEVHEKQLDPQGQSEEKVWVDRDLCGKESQKPWVPWKQPETSQLPKEDRLLLSVGLKQKSPLTIRTYTTESGENIPDYKQAVYMRGETEIPVIPGTSWAGAFRHHMEKMVKNPDSLKKLFGFKADRAESKEMTGKKSSILFCESEIEDAESKVVTRNAIDRFSGGTVDGALFTEKSCMGGSAELNILISQNDADKESMNALAASVIDLGLGILPIGGETSVGHGIFDITEIKVNGLTIIKGEWAKKPEEIKAAYEELAASLQT